MKRRAVVVDRTGRTVLGREGRRAVADGWDLTLIVGRDQVGRAAGARVVEVDDLTAASVAEALTLVQQKYGQVDRLATISEYLLLPVAQLREEQDIPGHGVEYTARLRDKWAMKQQARTAGLRHVDGLLAQQVVAGKRLPTHGPGYVLKPRAESGARGFRCSRLGMRLLPQSIVLSTQNDGSSSGSPWVRCCTLTALPRRAGLKCKSPATCGRATPQVA